MTGTAYRASIEGVTVTDQLGASRSVTRLTSDPWLLLADVVLVGVAYLAGLLLRFDGSPPPDQLTLLWLLLPVAVAVHITTFFVARLYGRVWREVGARDARSMIAAGVTATAVMFTGVQVAGLAGPFSSAVLMGGVLATGGAGAVRFRRRLLQVPARASQDHGTRVVLVGSVDVARHVIEQMPEDSPWTPVAVVNGHPSHWGRTMHGVPVYGPLQALPTVARLHAAEQVILTPSTTDQRTVRRAADEARLAGLPAKILPTVDDVLRGQPMLRSIRDLSIDDLLGRRQVETDRGAVRQLIVGRRILVTGGGGSIGSELARQIADASPEQLVLLDHDETHLHDVMAQLPDGANPVLADIRDASVVDRLFAEHAFDLVFHAAAHKHVPILERYPAEAVLTNVIGTDHLLRAAVRHGVTGFVAVSTDKAINPTSVMGATKRLSEQLLLCRQPAGARYCAVRFGNVLGSRGSVVPTFLQQIERGGPVTVTHPDMTRYFMSVEEAVQLVLQAAALTDGDEIFMLDMGDPVRILDLAERLIFLSGAAPGSIPIEFTGVRPGEKLEEELVAPSEDDLPTRHPDIRIVRSPRIDEMTLELGLEQLGRLAQAQAHAETIEVLFRLVGTAPTRLREVAS